MYENGDGRKNSPVVKAAGKKKIYSLRVFKMQTSNFYSLKRDKNNTFGLTQLI